MFSPLESSNGRVDCSESTAKQIDEEVKQLLDTAYADAKRILTDHRNQLELVAQALMTKETRDGEAFHKLLSRRP